MVRRLLSKYVLKRTATVAVLAAAISISFSTGIRLIAGVESDLITVIVRLTLPFLIAIPIGLYWFSHLEKLELSYRRAIQRANEMTRIASVDPLTGILNRRSFIKQFNGASSAGIRGWFLLADIDYLKVINDNYGHLVGDDAVVSVAQAMVNVLPSDSLIARIGGDEFCAFIPKASCADIDGIIEQMSAKADEELQRRQTGITHVLSLSVGYMPIKSNQKFKDAMSAADERLYRKKRARSPSWER